MFALALPYLIKWGIPFIIGGMIFGGAAWKIQGVRLSVAKADFATCSIANQTNTETIEQLKKQAESYNKSCQERIKGKDGTINRLREIDNLRGSNGQKVDANSNDPILNQLRGMFGNK